MNQISYVNATSDKNKKKPPVSDRGSLGLLALGYEGLLAWRKAQTEKERRSREQ